mmetsp:Transcript_39751/g.100147  ORF Transcript_39751/g.100147 Transcript_39751/m.100147 type:complete len:234 (-) Transcript_39751:1363-2064(-)
MGTMNLRLVSMRLISRSLPLTSAATRLAMASCSSRHASWLRASSSKSLSTFLNVVLLLSISACTALLMRFTSSMMMSVRCRINSGPNTRDKFSLFILLTLLLAATLARRSTRAIRQKRCARGIASTILTRAATFLIGFLSDFSSWIISPYESKGTSGTGSSMSHQDSSVVATCGVRASVSKGWPRSRPSLMAFTSAVLAEMRNRPSTLSASDCLKYRMRSLSMSGRLIVELRR